MPDGEKQTRGLRGARLNPLGLSLRASTFTVYAESSERLPTRLDPPPLAERTCLSQVPEMPEEGFPSRAGEPAIQC